jgi:tRNA threonylcarbamoyladenosine biosynthesis protein TsaE
MEWTLTPANMQDIARSFWEAYPAKKIFAFHASMGAGKTTLIRALCSALRVQTPVSSPSFSIINEYLYSQGKIYHIDLYRLLDQEEMLRAGVEECFYSGEICLIEWAEKAAEILPEQTVHVYLDIVDTTTRKIRT